MQSHQTHILILFISFALAVTILVDVVTYLSEARPHFADNEDGKVGWTNMMMYEIVVPILSVLGLLMHIMGLHLDFVSYLPETPTEGLLMVIGTAAHGAGWLMIGSFWTACEIGTFSSKTIQVAGQTQSTIVFRGGPAFCPQHKLVDGGLGIENRTPIVKVALTWTLVAVTLIGLVCAVRSWNNIKHTERIEEATRHRRTMGIFEMTSYPVYPGRSATMDVLGSYETKV